jgi:hypothetical protein
VRAPVMVLNEQVLGSTPPGARCSCLLLGPSQDARRWSVLAAAAILACLETAESVSLKFCGLTSCRRALQRQQHEFIHRGGSRPVRQAEWLSLSSAQWHSFTVERASSTPG